MRWVEWFDVIAIIFAVSVVFGFALRVKYLTRVNDNLRMENARLREEHVCRPPAFARRGDSPRGYWTCTCDTTYVVDDVVWDPRLRQERLSWITRDEFMTGVRPPNDRQERPQTGPRAVPRAVPPADPAGGRL